jgi:hypothetical protein
MRGKAEDQRERDGKSEHRLWLPQCGHEASVRSATQIAERIPPCGASPRAQCVWPERSHDMTPRWLALFPV